MARVRQIALSGRQTVEPAERQLMVQELDTLRERLLSIANSQHGGVALFGGTATDRLPFEKAPDGTVTYVGSEEPMTAPSEFGDWAAVLRSGGMSFRPRTGRASSMLST